MSVGSADMAFWAAQYAALREISVLDVGVRPDNCNENLSSEAANMEAANITERHDVQN